MPAWTPSNAIPPRPLKERSGKILSVLGEEEKGGGLRGTGNPTLFEAKPELEWQPFSLTSTPAAILGGQVEKGLLVREKKRL